MVKFNLKKLILEKSEIEQRDILYQEIVDATGISKQTLSKIAGRKPYNTSSNNIEQLCKFFDCSISEFMIIYD